MITDNDIDHFVWMITHCDDRVLSMLDTMVIAERERRINKAERELWELENDRSV